MSSLLSHCCLSLFDFAEPCTSCMLASFCSTIYDPLTLFLISAMAFVEENELVCLLRSFLEQPDIFRVRVSHVSGSLMIGTRRLLTLCLFCRPLSLYVVALLHSLNILATTGSASWKA